MTPQERQLIRDLFERLARAETAPRDPDAERIIAEGLSRAPNAPYALLQTVLVQDEALKRADARIRELSGGDTGAGGGARGSVPSVHPAATDSPDPRWNNGGAFPPAAYAAPAPGPSGSFLGTAAATAAGVIGGALLFNSLGSLLGHRGSGAAFGHDVPGQAPADTSPWDSNAAGSDLSRDAGLNDIGGNNASGAGLLDPGDTDMSDFGGDSGGGDGA